MNPLVTVCIPTYDRLAYLREAVSAALAQRYEPLEVLISDDGPTDSIPAWSRELAARDSRVRYQRNAHNLGLAGNWNALADAVAGEYLVIIGDDDRLLPEFASTLVRALDGADLAFSNHYLINAAGHRMEEASRRCTAHYHRDRLPAGALAHPAAVAWQNAIPMSASLIRTAAVRRLRFKEDLNTPEIELFVRLAAEGGRFVFVPDLLAEYRDHPASATSGGLMSERLVKYLEPLPVPPDIEPYKRGFMESLLRNAVSRALQQGDRRLARTFLASPYYPRAKGIKALVHHACAGLPALGPVLFRGVDLLRRAYLERRER